MTRKQNKQSKLIARSGKIKTERSIVDASGTLSQCMDMLKKTIAFRDEVIGDISEAIQKTAGLTDDEVTAINKHIDSIKTTAGEMLNIRKELDKIYEQYQSGEIGRNGVLTALATLEFNHNISDLPGRCQDISIDATAIVSIFMDKEGESNAASVQ